MQSPSARLDMHTAYQPPSRSPGLSWWTHLYIGAIALALAGQTPGQPAGRELLNSERIAAAFGSYGVEVLEQDEQVRVSNLFSGAGQDKTCRTFAIVRYPLRLDGAVSAEHAERWGPVPGTLMHEALRDGRVIAGT